MVSIRKFGMIVLVLNQIEYWSNYSIRNFEYSDSTNLQQTALNDSGTRDTRQQETTAGYKKTKIHIPCRAWEIKLTTHVVQIKNYFKPP